MSWIISLIVGGIDDRPHQGRCRMPRTAPATETSTTKHAPVPSLIRAIQKAKQPQADMRPVLGAP
jgi:hypothetical protein